MAAALLFLSASTSRPSILTRLAELVRFLASLHERQQSGAAQAYVLPLAVALQAQEPMSPAPLVHLQEEPIPVLTGAGIRQCCLYRQSRELFIGLTYFFTLTLGSPILEGEKSYPHILPVFAELQ
ncbi:MAG: hypothetical protein J7499_00245 [Sphingopyxis sp.]|nr:hypothetical protein [Sphingopyxis sp.]